MAKKIDPELKKLGEYLKLEKESFFVIPAYQRAYSWEIKQCDKLWQDLIDFIDNESADPYFFGTVIISCQDEDKNLSLIDGQQRTSTFILLFKALLIRINEAIEETKKDENSEKLNSTLSRKRDSLIKILYKANDEEAYDIIEDFNKSNKEGLLKNSSINEIYKDELVNIIDSKDYKEAEEKAVKIKYKQNDNKYTNYFRNFKFFYEKLEDLSASEINNFANYLLDKTELIEIRSWNVEQAITMFNSLNSDGLPLLDADIISAQLYSNSGDEIDEFNNHWLKFKEKVSDISDYNLLDIDDVLKQYMYIQRSLDKAYISDSGSISVTTPGIRRYYTEENKNILNDPLTLTGEFSKIVDTWNKIKDYPIVQLALKFNENIKTYIISYLYRFNSDVVSEHKATMFIEELLKLFTVLELVDLGYSSAKFKTFLFGLNIKLVDEKVALEEIIKDIKKHIANNWKREELLANIKSYTKNPLVALDEYIYCKQNDIKFVLPEKYEIEHIMPMSGKNIEYIRADAKIESKEEFLSIVNKLGNKILLEDNINRSIGNAWFKTKINHSIKNAKNEKRGYKDSKFAAANSIIKDYENIDNPIWTKDSIDQRTDEIANRIVDFIFS